MSMIEQSQGLTGMSGNRTIPLWRQLRWNLILFAILLTLIPVLVVGIFVLQQTRTQTLNQVNYQLESVTALKQNQIARWLSTSNQVMDIFLSNATASNLFASFATEGVGGSLSAFVNATLLNGIDAQREDDAAFKEFFLYDLNGKIIASSDDAQVGKIVNRQPYFTASLGGSYVQTPYYDISTSDLTMIITRPVLDISDTTVAIIAGRLNITTLGNIMTERSGLGDTGETYLVSIENNYLLTPSRFEGYDPNRAYRTEGINKALSGENGVGLYTNYRGSPVVGVYRWIPELKAAFLAEIDESEAFALYNQTLSFGTISIIVAAIVATAIALYYATRVSKPITLLTDIASRIASGDLSQRANIAEPNEIGLLASTFNSMTDQLQDFVATLEERVNDRTRDLQIVAEVSKSATTLLNLNDLLQAVVNLTKDSFSLYHAHIYLLDAEDENLVLAAGAGEAGRAMKERGHAIPLNRPHSIVARAARERRGVIANDVAQDPDFLPNPLLPDTRSELAVPMIVGNRLIGVLDVQADSPNRFSDEDVRVQTSLADQVAVAVENARAFARIQEAQEEVTRIYDLSVDMIGFAGFDGYFKNLNPAWEDTLGWTIPELLTKPFIEFVHPDDRQRTLDEYAAEMAAGKASISFENRYQCKDGSYKWISWNAVPYIAESTTYFVARDVTENKQIQAERQVLFEAANRLNAAHERHEVLEAILPFARDNGAISANLLYIDSDSSNLPEWAEIVGAWAQTGAMTTSVGTRFYLPEFPFAKLWMSNPHGATFIEDVNTDNQVDDMTRGIMLQTGSIALAILPLTTQGRWVGLIAFSWREPIKFTAQDRRIYASMLRQTTAVVDALRSSEQTAKRAAELETVAQVSAATTSILDVEQMLLAVANLTKDRFALYHVHIYLLDETGQKLILIAGAGEAGRIMRERGHNIPLNRENSIVARAARSREGVIVNDVTKAPEFLPNPLLPNTKAEMAVPMIVGNALIGVMDVQADIANGFNDDDVAIQSTLADQIAVAVQNARAFTRIQETEAAVREREQRYQQILDGVADLILVKGAKSRIAWANKAFREYYGMSQEELQGLIDAPFAEPDYTQQYILDDAYVFENGLPLEIPEEPVKRYDGTVRLFQTVKTPIFDESGQVFLTVGVSRDITERKLAEQQEAILYAVSRELANARTSADVLAAMSAFVGARGVNASSLFHIDTEEGVPTWLEAVAAEADNPGAAPPLGTRFYLPEFPFSKLWMSDPTKPLMVGDTSSFAQDDPATYAVFQQFGVAGIATIPMYAQERWLGLMTFSWHTPIEFTAQDELLLTAVMRQATSTLDALRSAALTAKRAAELQTVAQVSAAAAMILDANALLQSVVDYTKESFNLYHTHIYLTDETGENLILAAGAGEAGRIMKEQGRTISIHHQNSLVARAAHKQDGVISNDVAQEAGFLPNPLLPDTKSEMAIPLIVGDELIGVLDVQADTVNRFTADDVAIQSTLADQIAVAVQNARTFQIQQETAERLRQVDHLKSQFLANMSHELRTPLNSIIGYAEVLLDGIDGELSDEAVEDVQAIHGGGKHLLTIINDILDLAKIEAGQMFMDRQEANLGQVVDEVVATCHILAKNKDIALNVELDGEIPSVFGDPIRLKQITFNLVNNAIKFTEKGGVTVNLGLMNDRNEVVVAVRDTGIGMTQEDMAGLFQQFHQVDGSATRRAGGTGLGLVITRHLVHMHEGEIYVESEKGVGSTFWFTLPVYTNQPRQRA